MLILVGYFKGGGIFIWFGWRRIFGFLGRFLVLEVVLRFEEAIGRVDCSFRADVEGGE